MGDGTGISWTDATWNPVRGCSRVSEGCRNCYAERVAARFSGPGQPYEGLARIKTTIANNEERDPGNKRAARWTGVVRLIPEHLADPLCWKKPRRIFVNSMSDLFHESLTNEQIAAVFGVMAAAPQHTFQVLTKRAKRMREWFEWVGTSNLDALVGAAISALGMRTRDYERVKRGKTWPLPNVWLGVSVENQDAADERIPELLRTPAAVRFLSCEPLIGPVDLRPFLARANHLVCPRCLFATNAMNWRLCPNDQSELVADFGVNWVIAGCESGPGARECKVEWLRSLRDQCAAAGVAFFLKQAEESADDDNLDGTLDSPIECMPEGAPVVAISKRKARRPGGNHVIELPHLDGKQHAAFPEAGLVSGCDVMRTKAEGGGIFTVCDGCWDADDVSDPTTLPESLVFVLCSEDNADFLDRMRTLAQNIKIGAGLCRTHESGYRIGGANPQERDWWKPGCGRPHP